MTPLNALRTTDLDRRAFVRTASAAVTAGVMAVHTSIPAQEALRPISVGVMGLSRGRDIAKDLATMPGAKLAYLCDVDSDRLAAGQKLVRDFGDGEPKAVTDFRRMLDDSELDAIFCAAPNHWHAPATILACKAGKDIYVEKPCSHNPAEGELMTDAARVHGRVVQMGSQRRSSPSVQAAIKKLHDGAIGRVYAARAFYGNARGSIGRGKLASPPAKLDYRLWEGPAPHQAYRDNVVHYNWHWFWHWGNGELGNNGIHYLDLCRWGLNVVAPERVTSTGGRLAFSDDQQTPDTQTVTFEFPEQKMIVWQHFSCSPRVSQTAMVFHGTDGILELDGGGEARLYDQRQKLVETIKGTGWGQREHFDNFLHAVRDHRPQDLNQPIAEGAASTLLCHLGNISQRVGRSLVCDPQTGRIADDADASALWSREYAPAWEKDVATV